MGIISSEGVILNKFFESKFNKNRNVLLAVTGSTGSGKSYSCLRMCELWYLHRFNKPFPIENVCFSITEVMKRLNCGELKKGELIIIEEAGVLLGSLDFQQRIQKLFTYVLQSFRSLNIGLILNLPVLSMLNKNCRLLLHGHMITERIDYSQKKCYLKCMLHQLNQQSGKSYWKFPRVVQNGFSIPVNSFGFSLPSNELIERYEKLKIKFVSGLNEEYLEILKKQEDEVNKKLARNNLTNVEQNVYNLIQKGLKVKEIAEKLGVSVETIYDTKKRIEKKGFNTKIEEIASKMGILNTKTAQIAI
jgi:DNA-binding CsgD family transcriptional regulator